MICAGGRYDGWLLTLGGLELDLVLEASVERLLLILEKQVCLSLSKRLDIYI